MYMMVMRILGRFVFEEGASCKTATDGERRLGRVMTCELGDLSEEAAGLLLLLLLLRHLLGGRGLGWRVRGRGSWSLCRARVIPLGDTSGGVEVEPGGGMLGYVLTDADLGLSQG